MHLCGNPDWDFLLSLDIEVLSLDVYTNAEVFASYAAAVGRFLDRGGVIVWGIVPTNFEPFQEESVDSVQRRLEEVWQVLARRGVDLELLLSRSLLSPATCCLVNPDREKTVESAFAMIRNLSQRLRENYQV